MTPEEVEKLIDEQIAEMFPSDRDDDVERCANRIADALEGILRSLDVIIGVMRAK